MAAARGHPRSQGRSGRAGAGQAPPSCRSSRALVKKSNEETSQRSKHTEARVYSNLIHLQTAVGESGSMRSRRTLHLNLTACRLGPPPSPPHMRLGKRGSVGVGVFGVPNPKETTILFTRAAGRSVEEKTTFSDDLRRPRGLPENSSHIFSSVSSSLTPHCK